MQNRRVILLGVVGLFGLCCLAAFGWMVVSGLQEDREREQAAAEYAANFGVLEAVCSGTSAAGAAAFQADTGLHPTAAFRVIVGEATLINDNLPATWKPGGLADAQFVACVEPAQVLVETCEYDILGEGGEATGETGKVLRYQWETNVRLLEAQTGKLVDENKFVGGVPEACPDNVVFLSGLTSQSREGESVGLAIIEEWLRPFVETP